MIPGNREATHPGVILLKEFLEPLGLTRKAFAEHVGIPARRVNEIVRGRRGVTPETAWLLSEALRTSPEFWLNLQAGSRSLRKPSDSSRRWFPRARDVVLDFPRESGHLDFF